eukprot:265268-Chlamydomonas_euryale.AAC.5
MEVHTDRRHHSLHIIYLASLCHSSVVRLRFTTPGFYHGSWEGAHSAARSVYVSVSTQTHAPQMSSRACRRHRPGVGQAMRSLRTWLEGWSSSAGSPVGCQREPRGRLNHSCRPAAAGGG